MFVVFDLDGTLALNEHRQHFVQRTDGKPKDWRAFFAACDLDVPNLPLIGAALAFNSAGDRVEIWSGRSAEVNAKTEEWLRRHNLHILPRRMRAEGDHTPDHDLKAQWLHDSNPKPDLVFDDRASVVAMWRANGIVCAQVAPGDF